MVRGAGALALAGAVAATALLVSPAAGGAQAPPADRMRVLFLGDNGHHRPIERAQQLLPALAPNGIDVFYTDRTSDLNEAELDRHHALVLYNNQPRISDVELAALLGFVEDGGGLVVIHSASASFQNSEAFIRLVGAAFKSHGTGTFSAERVAPDHPVVQGVPIVESWDETYVHTKHNPVDRTILEVRREAGHAEPWTWVRTYGDGRVFYTAWGHDERTWGNEAFQQLIGQGLKWAAGDWALTRVTSDPVYPEEELEFGLPIYARPPARWNTLEGMIDRIQGPLPPDEAMELVTVRPGLRAELFASEPMIRNVIDFAWDERGRMWVVETVDYPNTVLPEGEPGNDRILILEDGDGDGRADEVKVFADGLNLATTLAFANGGVIVGQAPHMLFFRDTDGDDRADERKILFTGWPRRDTHGSISNLRYGFDNTIWGSVGYNGFRGTVGEVIYERGDFGAGYFRFPADGAWLDYVARTSNNTWGVAFTEDNLVFGSTANSRPSSFVHIPGRYYRALTGETPVLPGIQDRNDVYPLRDIRQVDQFDRYTAGAAHEVYTARRFPESYWNRAAFVAEPTGHLVGMFELIPDGSTFEAKNRWNLMASRDPWAAPVQVKVGPDGAVWVSDFYTLVAQHNPSTPHFEAGEGAAYETPHRDNVHARIYRIVPEDAPEPEATRLDGATPEQLLEALGHDNLFWRLTAQRLLVERGVDDVVPALARMVDDHTMDALGLNPRALHALWTLDGLDAVSGGGEAQAAVRRALHHPAASLRRAALQVLPRDAQLMDEIFDAGILPDRSSPHTVDYTVGTAVLQDANARVRVEALLALAEVPGSERARTAIADMAMAPQNARDPWLPDAVAIAAIQQDPGLITDLLARRPAAEDSDYLDGLRTAVRLMTHHHAAQENTDVIVAVLLAVPDANPTVASGVLDAVGGGERRPRPGWPDESPPNLTAEQRAALAAAARDAAPELAEGFARIAERWGMPDLFGGL